jgi:hypothetical protein
MFQLASVMQDFMATVWFVLLALALVRMRTSPPTVLLGVPLMFQNVLAMKAIMVMAFRAPDVRNVHQMQSCQISAILAVSRTLFPAHAMKVTLEMAKPACSAQHVLYMLELSVHAQLEVYLTPRHAPAMRASMVTVLFVFLFLQHVHW